MPHDSQHQLDKLHKPHSAHELQPQHSPYQLCQPFLLTALFFGVWCLSGAAYASGFVTGQRPPANAAPPAPGDVATPLPPGAKPERVPEEPRPRNQLEGELLALDALIDRLERKDKRFEGRLLGPTLLFGAGCFVTLVGIIAMSILPSMAVSGLLFGTPGVWLVVGAVLAVVGFVMVVAGGVWHGPIHKRRSPGMQDLKELKVRRKHLANQLRRRFPKVSTLHMPYVANTGIRIAF